MGTEFASGDHSKPEESSQQPSSSAPPPRLSRFAVAYVDILGYQALIQKSFANQSGNEELVKLRTAFDRSYTLAHNKHEGSELSAMRFFTDNFVIAARVVDSDREHLAIETLLSELAMLQCELFPSGYFLRGAIALGDFYMDSEIVFGPTLLEAYKAEQELALWPRIIVVGAARDCLESVIQRGCEFLPIARDVDDQLFVDYLEASVFIAYPDDRVFDEVVSDHKSAVESKLLEFKSVPRIWTKYFWAAQYHNSFCRRASQHLSEDLLIPEAQIVRQFVHYHREHNEAPSWASGP